MNNSRSVIDVSDLPLSAIDHRSPIWIGNALLLLIETTMFAILVAAYFYFRQNFANWPPPQTNYYAPNFHPAPDLLWGTVTLFTVVAAAVCMIAADFAALRFDRAGVVFWTGLTVTIGFIAIGLRFREFWGTQFRWDDNAYSAVVWGLLLMHLLHLFVGVAEDLLMVCYISIYGLDDKHARDVRVTAVYWYWIAGIWIPIYAILYFGPYWLGT